MMLASEFRFKMRMFAHATLGAVFLWIGSTRMFSSVRQGSCSFTNGRYSLHVHIYILFGEDFAETVNRGLEHGSPCTKEIHKLFRIGIPTGWPQAPTPSSRENHAESSIVFYVHEIDLVTYSVRRYEI